MWIKSSVTIPAVAAISLCLIGGTSPAAADILHVPGDFPTIQEAIDAAMDGDEVEVHPGTYNETINFLGKAIRVYSTDGPIVTIIDAQQTGTVVTCTSAEGPDSVLEGFTITGGSGGDVAGGGMTIFSSPTVTNCTFILNTATALFGGGGGMFILNDSSPTVTNCAFIGNTAVRGGGMYIFGSDPTVTNCTFSGNTATDDGGAIHLANFSDPTLTNCILWGDIPDEIFIDSGMLIVTWSDVQGGIFGIGNIDADPRFVDAAADNLRLDRYSPCVDAGDNDGVPAGILTDLDDNPRFVDDAGVADTGNAGVPGPPIVDMGA